MREMLQSKIHKAVVTQADLNYIGSITIDEELLELVDLWPGQKVLIVSNTNGARLETYVIKGERGSGEICLNGAAAHLINVGHEVIIIGFQMTDQKDIRPKQILVDKNNKFIQYL
ncbi:aspartate 1-decarboxylase [Halobacteriovorax sp. GFR7]|uniref:aspartate 1-decarboxylase n=2 Tax=Bacteriovoracia TaxID=3031419 RepID=UPI00038640F4|nr:MULTISPECIES: aspartate 1-decarboxylase [Bacteriovoracales]EPZ50847.1 aspartate 1-decarboxylase [Bacteriovorax sp. BAL6_X]POB14337.1 aspartate 1-decarboxylase [Halobacteriovorax sp. DA5]